ncbi:MAG: hypothetical protein ACRDRX_26305 [Pseudonocardiaceae bacterium]
MRTVLNFSELDGQKVELLPARTLLSAFSQDVVGSVGSATGGVSNGTVFGSLGQTSGQVLAGSPVGNFGNFFAAIFSGK